MDVFVSTPEQNELHRNCRTTSNDLNGLRWTGKCTRTTAAINRTPKVCSSWTSQVDQCDSRWKSPPRSLGWPSTSRSPVGSVDPWRIREDRIVHAKEPFKIPGNSIKISECSSSYGVGVTVRKPFHTALTCLNYRYYSLKQSTSSLPNVM